MIEPFFRGKANIAPTSAMYYLPGAMETLTVLLCAALLAAIAARARQRHVPQPASARQRRQ
jgi:hypothetical protein